jgi:hypothetical protein
MAGVASGLHDEKIANPQGQNMRQLMTGMSLY